MTAVADSLPLTETLSPADAPALASAVADAFATGTAIYPLGGGTSLNYGTTAVTPGLGLSMTRLDRVIDYPVRDMTITVEAGITLERLAEVLVEGGQWLPIDVPQPATATLGGAVATAWSGARRYGYGTLRDYVIGISAVDGRGIPFKAGGRVVKNVAGYDFCKLLTGSHGTLGVITQLTLKLKPIPQRSAFLVCDLPDPAAADALLAALVNSATTPVAVELLAGPAWRDNAALGTLTAGSHARVAGGLEGTQDEVRWMLEQLAAEWREQGMLAVHALDESRTGQLWRDLAEFPALPDAPLVIKASVPASYVGNYVRQVLAIDPAASIQAHAGNGIVIARFSQFDATDVSRSLIGRLQPAAQLSGGHVVVLSSSLGTLTRQAVWGAATAATTWMNAVKRQFDPKNLLNPGRFVYDH